MLKHILRLKLFHRMNEQVKLNYLVFVENFTVTLFAERNNRWTITFSISCDTDGLLCCDVQLNWTPCSQLDR